MKRLTTEQIEEKAKAEFLKFCEDHGVIWKAGCYLQSNGQKIFVDGCLEFCAKPKKKK